MRRAAKLPKGWFYCKNCAKPKEASPRRPPGAQKFCSDECRKEFWRSGNLSPHRLKEAVRGWIREMLPGQLAAYIESPKIGPRTELALLRAAVGELRERVIEVGKEAAAARRAARPLEEYMPPALPDIEGREERKAARR